MDYVDVSDSWLPKRSMVGRVSREPRLGAEGPLWRCVCHAIGWYLPVVLVRAAYYVSRRNDIITDSVYLYLMH
jgi:hypothetical protein